MAIVSSLEVPHHHFPADPDTLAPCMPCWAHLSPEGFLCQLWAKLCPRHVRLSPEWLFTLHLPSPPWESSRRAGPCRGGWRDQNSCLPAEELRRFITGDHRKSGLPVSLGMRCVLSLRFSNSWLHLLPALLAVLHPVRQEETAPSPRGLGASTEPAVF